MDRRPPLTIVIGTGEGWPYVRDMLESIRADAEAAEAEIVIADGSSMAAPPSSEIGRAVRWLKLDAPSVFSLYLKALREARGDVVALTEDHAVPRPGWVPAIIRAHAAHPEAAAIGGAIENGSTDSLLDWASYFSTQGQHMGPLGDRVVRMTTNEANVSYKRWALDGLDDNDGLGFMAIMHNRRLAESGAILRDDDRMVVDHMETIGFVGQTSIHFHNGRSIAGFRRRNGMSNEEWLRMGVSSCCLRGARCASFAAAWPRAGIAACFSPARRGRYGSSLRRARDTWSDTRPDRAAAQATCARRRRDDRHVAIELARLLSAAEVYTTEGRRYNANNAAGEIRRITFSRQ